MKIFLQTCLLLIVGLSLPFSATAQKCKTNIIRQQHIEQTPSIQHRINQLNQFTEQYIWDNQQQSRSRQVVTLNVVVHVLWHTEEENISDAQIQSQIKVLNEDFNLNNANFSTTPSPFQSLAAAVGIEFQLASVDPNGNPTTGITRTRTSVDQIGQTEHWYSDASGGKTAWDNKRYINIWVCNIGGDILGFASPPGTADEDDGLVIGSNFFGTTGTAADSAPNHLGKTATHEMGHYFNLEHVWGIDGGCDDDDLVTDTPNQNEESYDCPSFPHYDKCTTSGNGINFNNFMDYSNDECLTMFTEGQKMRMLAALNGPRASLLSNGPCLPTGTSCDDKNPNTQNDVEDGNCNCIGELCPPAGTACNDGKASTKEDKYDDNCNCIGTPCPAMGTACDDGLSITENDIEDGNCNCRGTLCPAPDTACDDGDPNTQNDVEDGNCNCKGTLTITCPVAGTACNDNNPATENDMEDGNCNCNGTLIVTCPVAGTVCDDNSSATENDVEDGNCNCKGTLIVNCPVAGTACDDNNPATENDTEDGNCNCKGTLIDTCPTAGTVCNDNNPATENDVEDGNCNCKGTIPANIDVPSNDLLTTYPALANLFENCAEESVSIYKSGIHTYFLITSPTGSILYNEQGQLYCTNTTNYDCLEEFNLTELVATSPCRMEVTAPATSDSDLFNTYPWLHEILDPTNCSANILVYLSGGYEYLLIENDTTIILYNATGTVYCTNTANYDCTDFYQIEEEITKWSCTDSENDAGIAPEITSLYPWLTDLINTESCTATTLTIYQQGPYKYFLIETANGTKLYNEDGNLYCTDQPNYSCTSLYNLETVEYTWACKEGAIQRMPTKAAISSSARKDFGKYLVYPNPNNGQFYIDFAKVENLPELIKVFDVQGQLIQILPIDSKEKASNMAITIATPTSGVYFLQFYSKSGVQTERIIVQ